MKKISKKRTPDLRIKRLPIGKGVYGGGSCWDCIHHTTATTAATKACCDEMGGSTIGVKP